MLDTPKIPGTTSGPTPNATLVTPTDLPPAAPLAVAATAPRPELNLADTARLLAEHFPALFGEGLAKPIKLRIQADINRRAPGVFTKKALSIFLQRHTTRTAYLRALVAEGATRIDLDGQPAGEISAEHRDAAGVELERRRIIVGARRPWGATYLSSRRARGGSRSAGVRPSASA
jgi:ProP effector